MTVKLQELQLVIIIAARLGALLDYLKWEVGLVGGIHLGSAKVQAASVYPIDFEGWIKRVVWRIV